MYPKILSYDEAIRKISEMYDLWVRECGEEDGTYSDSAEMAKEGIRKQFQRMVPNEIEDAYFCPTCGHSLKESGTAVSYCDRCGQILKWN